MRKDSRFPPNNVGIDRLRLMAHCDRDSWRGGTSNEFSAVRFDRSYKDVEVKKG